MTNSETHIRDHSVIESKSFSQRLGSQIVSVVMKGKSIFRRTRLEIILFVIDSTSQRLSSEIVSLVIESQSTFRSSLSEIISVVMESKDQVKNHLSYYRKQKHISDLGG